MLGDLDRDGTLELAVGAFMSDGGRGAIWILSLDSESFEVVSKLKIGAKQAGFNEDLPDVQNSNGSYGGQLGHALAAVGDLNGDGTIDLATGANQFNEGYGYLLYLNEDKTVKTFNRINNQQGGFGLNLKANERFSRSISFAPNIGKDGHIAINMGGGAGQTGTLYSLQYKPCEIQPITGNNYWSAEDPLYSNWDHVNQRVSESLSLEQCWQKSSEVKGYKITTSPSDFRCIVHDANAELTTSIEGSVGYLNQCFE